MKRYSKFQIITIFVYDVLPNWNNKIEKKNKVNVVQVYKSSQDYFYLKTNICIRSLPIFSKRIYIYFVLDLINENTNNNDFLYSVIIIIYDK